MQRFKMGFSDYIQALEQERRKIQVFPKELPLSLELVTQACRQQLSGTTTEYNLNGQSECSEQTTSTDGPVLEEFIPIKKRASSYSQEVFDDVEDYDQHFHHKQQKLSLDNKKKSDWLRSVQLWNSDPSSEEDVTKKAVPVLELKRNGCGGGAFHPFHKEDRVNNTTSELLSKGQPSSTGVAAVSSNAATVTSNNVENRKRDEKEEKRKQRRCWSQELHKRFLKALQQLGGADCATPKQIREVMNVDGLTNDEVKSHLQKYRLHTRRPSSTNNESANSQTAAPFVLVGNIFVQQQEYGGVASSTTTGEMTKVVAPSGIYAPVATHPQVATIKKPEFKKFEHSISEERGNNSEGAVHSNSPTSSSSTHTTTNASTGY
ncbi:transcription factor HHO2 isoform X2 [Medicago truncatula]|uniref:transcription factor HHO2 isoform X2 n=1 Tax=Medicago truncatula TaxID=3880 RepID=UPI00196817DC|nr:transcription factor HHO2 isoform X2 [Medicago truncatula]